MTKRALIIGISDYAPLAADLPSSRVEIERWRALLQERYAFPPSVVHVIADQYARRSAILDQLVWLLDGAKAGDQRVFVFCGHGVRIPQPRPPADRIGGSDEGIVLYPGGAPDPLDVALFDSDLAGLYRSLAIERGALTTFIFDSCYSAGLDFSETGSRNAFGVLSANVPNADRQAIGMLTMGLRLTAAEHSTSPVVIAACGESATAKEVDRGGVARSLFSQLATAALQEQPSMTYLELMSSVATHMGFAAQRPVLRGDIQRTERRFFD